MKLLTEKLDFSFAIRDFEIITELLDQYLDDRVFVFNKLINENDFTNEEKKQYIHYFISACIEDKKQHEYLSKIQHFLSREYEVFNHPEIASVIDTLSSIFFTNVEDYSLIEDFENYEVETISVIYDSWQTLTELISVYPLLDLDTYKYEVIDFVPIYYKDAESFVLKEVKSFIHKIKKEFPSSLRRLDSIILCDKDYIEYVAGEGTMAYFISDNVFMPSSVDKDNELFFVTTIYHEFGHFVYSLLPEECQILWQDYFIEWVNNGVKLTRDENNDVEEVFADVFSLVYNQKNPDYIHEPSKIITNTFKEILNRGFNK
ncbi:MAG: hypothetical protein AB7V16_07300 [Vulcanibacillus sp.]